jgi:hypothetical protein
MLQLVRILARAVVIVVIASLFPAKLHASELWLDPNYATPVRWNFGASLFFFEQKPRCDTGWFNIQRSDGCRRSIIAGGSVGRGGMQAWGGKTLPGDEVFGEWDFRAVVTRTWDHPRGASPNSTYVGGEVGWWLVWRFSVGYAKRVSGPSPGDGHTLTWGVGFEIPALR